MIELQMVKRMAIRALVIAPAIIGVLWIWGGPRYGLSAAIGIAMTILNLWLSGLIIGGVADRNPQLLMPVAMATFMLGLLVLTGIALGLRNLEAVEFPVTGFVLIGSHLLVVLWEATGAYDKVEKPGSTSGTPMKVRS
ncbi:MAG TPA: hypothetical protein VEV82_09990 [Actinomycetota bacterium]|nr:hypothetical protein [Actinomycetota bacterium]